MSDLIKIFVYEPNYIWKKLMIYEFIKKGILLKIISSQNKLINIFSKNVGSFLLLVNVKQAEEPLFSLYKDYKTNISNKKSLFFPYIKEKPDYQLLYALKKASIDNLILRGENPKQFCKQVIQQCLNKGAHIEKRKYLRIILKKEDSCKVIINVIKQKTPISIHGCVTNISLGGCFFKIKEQQHLHVLEKKDDLIKVKIKFKDMMINTKASILHIKDAVLAIKFIDMPEYDKQILGIYIYSHIEEVYKNINIDAN